MLALPVPTEMVVREVMAVLFVTMILSNPLIVSQP
jgi:hypothetical protein